MGARGPPWMAQLTWFQVSVRSYSVAGPVGEPLPGAHKSQVLGIELGPVIGGEGELDAVLEGHMGGVLPAVLGRPQRRLLPDHVVIRRPQLIRPMAIAEEARQIRGGDGLLQGVGRQPLAGADGREERVEGRSRLGAQHIGNELDHGRARRRRVRLAARALRRRRVRAGRVLGLLRSLLLLRGLLAIAGVDRAGLRTVSPGLANLAAGAILCRLAFLGSRPGNLPGDDTTPPTRQQHRPRRVGAMGLEIETQRSGQNLLLGQRQNLEQRFGVVVMRAEQRQAGEQIRTNRFSSRCACVGD